MNTYCLRSTSRTTIIDACITAGALVADGTPSQGIIWDEIGAIYEPTGNTIETDDGPVDGMAPRADENGTPYWHANVYSGAALDLPTELLIVPTAPVRKLWVE
ncbi:hypothetical protein [Solimonas marina]|uniref:Uncharacterized protein n=1 Tax=Solimonas marina TaxID=2714601 RepID=A0A969W9W2_9GAMM|nr:hypothetical protein [Solimonas marina]NKF21601.1 hypothetical protein [Solimonas marina]